MNTAQHPGPLTLGFGEVHVRISVHDGDRNVIVVETKDTANIARTLVRTYARTDCQAVSVKAEMPAAPRLWIGNTIVDLQTDDHAERAHAWCEAYNRWIAAGELRGVQ